MYLFSIVIKLEHLTMCDTYDVTWNTIFKNTKITERVTSELRVEFFNLINHPNLGQPNTSGSVNSVLSVVAPGKPNPPAAPEVREVRLPRFTYPIEVRLAAAALLSGGRSEAPEC